MKVILIVVMLISVGCSDSDGKVKAAANVMDTCPVGAKLTYKFSTGAFNNYFSVNCEYIVIEDSNNESTKG